MSVHSKRKPYQYISRVGEKFGRLTVLNESRIDGIWWCECKCDCGKAISIKKNYIIRGHKRSCGCLRAETYKTMNRKHGYSTTKLGRVYNSMCQRCSNPNNIGYKHYGDRGIQVCAEWKNNPASFYEWAISNGYKEGLTIDRINVNGNYEPTNCRWIPQKEQGFNRTDNVFYEMDGVRKTETEWVEEYGINKGTFRDRIERGWTFREAITTPPIKHGYTKATYKEAAI